MPATVAKREPQTAPSPWRDPFTAVREEVDSLLSEFVDRDLWPKRISPRFDLAETGEAMEARMDVPGMKPEDIDIQVSGNMLTISGERKEEKEEKGEKRHRVERRWGSFSRCVMLPCAVQEDKIDAKYADGVLTITLPKTEEAKSRKIKVKT